MPDQLSKAYYSALERTRRHHAKKRGKTFSGRFTWKQRDRIKGLVDRFEAKTILDYGAGWGQQYLERDAETGQSLAEMWGVDPFKYDPGVPHFQTEPVGKFDLVICVQVLGSIPTSDLSAIIDRLYAHAGKAVYVAERVGLQPHKPIFDDMKAEMPHGQPVEWWIEMLRRPDADGKPKMIAAFRNQDQTTGWPGWRIEEL